MQGAIAKPLARARRRGIPALTNRSICRSNNTRHSSHHPMHPPPEAIGFSYPFLANRPKIRYNNPIAKE